MQAFVLCSTHASRAETYWIILLSNNYLFLIVIFNISLPMKYHDFKIVKKYAIF